MSIFADDQTSPCIILLFRADFLAIMDGVEITVTGLFAGFLAVMITLGKNETCESIEKLTASFGIP